MSLRIRICGRSYSIWGKLQTHRLVRPTTRRTSIINENCFNFTNFKKNFNDKFDIIFIDPPYKEEKINLLINIIKDEKILKKEGILIIHRHKKDKIIISNRVKIIDERNYGISKIMIGR